MLSPETVELILKGGLISFLTIAWIRAEMRADREREKNDTLARDSITTAVKTEATLDKLIAIFTGRKLDQ